MHDLLLKLFLNRIYYLTCISTINIHKTKVYFNSENTKDLNPLRLKLQEIVIHKYLFFVISIFSHKNLFLSLQFCMVDFFSLKTFFFFFCNKLEIELCYMISMKLDIEKFIDNFFSIELRWLFYLTSNKKKLCNKIEWFQNYLHELFLTFRITRNITLEFCAHFLSYSRRHHLLLFSFFFIYIGYISTKVKKKTKTS